MLYFRKIIEQKRTSPKNVGTSTLAIEVLQEKRKNANFIIQHIYSIYTYIYTYIYTAYIQLKPTDFTTKHVTQGIQRIAEMETPANLRQYAIHRQKKEQ